MSHVDITADVLFFLVIYEKYNTKLDLVNLQINSHPQVGIVVIYILKTPLGSRYVKRTEFTP